MPEYCLGCGRVFDLWQYFVEARDVEEDGAVRERLCEECRENVSLDADNVFIIAGDTLEMESSEGVGESVNGESVGSGGDGMVAAV